MVTRVGRRELLKRSGAFAACALALPCGATASDVAPPPLVAVAEPIEAPAIDLADIEGNMHATADYRGKVVVVSFWAAWCAPCRRELPSLARLKRNLPFDRFAILAINLGDGPDRIRDFLFRLDHEGLVIVGDERTILAKPWNVYGLPVSYAVDPAGQIRFSALGALEWDAATVRDQLCSLAV